MANSPRDPSSMKRTRAPEPRRRPGSASLLRATFRGAFWNTYDNLGPFVLANLVWIALCLPVVTAPAATAALFDLARRAADGESVGVRDFAGGFRAHFLPALRLGLFDLAAALLLWVNIDFYGHLGGWATLPGFLLAGVMIWIGGFWLLMHAHLMPLLAAGERSFAQLLKKAALLTLDNPGYTVGVTVQAAALTAICLVTGAGFLLAGGALVAVLLATGHRQLLQKYNPPPPGEEIPPDPRGLRELFRPWETPRRTP